MYKLHLHVDANRMDQRFIVNCYNVRYNMNFFYGICYSIVRTM